MSDEADPSHGIRAGIVNAKKAKPSEEELLGFRSIFVRFLPDKFLYPITIHITYADFGEGRIHNVLAVTFTVHPLGHDFLRTALTHGDIFTSCHERNAVLFHHVKWRTVRWAVVVEVVVVGHVCRFRLRYIGQGRVQLQWLQTRFCTLLVYQIGNLLRIGGSIHIAVCLFGRSHCVVCRLLCDRRLSCRRLSNRRFSHWCLGYRSLYLIADRHGHKWKLHLLLVCLLHHLWLHAKLLSKLHIWNALKLLYLSRQGSFERAIGGCGGCVRKAGEGKTQSQSRNGNCTEAFHIHIVSFFWPTRLVDGFGLRKQPYAHVAIHPMQISHLQKRSPALPFERKFRLFVLA